MLLLLGCVAIASCLGTNFISHAPNRLADGISYPIWDAPPLAAVAVVILLSGLVALGFVSRPRLALVVAVALAFLVPVAAGRFAIALIEPGHPAQRQALGPGFWILQTIAALAMLDAMDALRWRLGARAFLLVAVSTGFAACAHGGLFDALSLTREVASHRALFVEALIRHVVLVVAAVVISLVVCAPLTWAVRLPTIRAPVFSTLGLLQTVPSIALFGLLITPLGLLAAHVPALHAVGVSGLGVTPTLIALVLYSAYPLVRMSDAAFAAVPVEVTDAATGLGYGRRQRFWSVDLPLALPVMISGLRVVTLQAIGLATVAALIGGGGLGTFIFEGIGQYALDLVLIGAIPVILLALTADFSFRLVLSAVRVPA